MILDDIVAKKKQRLQTYNYISNTNKTYTASFYDSLKTEGLSIIGEIKKASPSKGLIKPNFNHVELAKQYEASCVDAISVLTEEDFFLGSPKYLIDVHKEVKLPLLRKDFIIDKNQIIESKNIGASAILLIVSILTKFKLKEFLEISNELGLDALVETHNEAEIETALEADSKIIGINNRDLKTFKVDLNNTLRLRQLIPNNIVVVAESGINTIEDIKFIKQSNIDAILVGESFMKSDNIKLKAEEFKKAYNN